MIHGRIDDRLQILVPITLTAYPDNVEIEAVLDTGFNGELILTKEYEDQINATRVGRVRSELADGRVVEEDLVAVSVSFDGETKLVLASFVDSADSLIGTQLLLGKRLMVNFVSGEVIIEQVH
jgi:clan AA aspartic protease